MGSAGALCAESSPILQRPQVYDSVLYEGSLTLNSPNSYTLESSLEMDAMVGMWISRCGQYSPTFSHPKGSRPLSYG